MPKSQHHCAARRLRQSHRRLHRGHELRGQHQHAAIYGQAALRHSTGLIEPVGTTSPTQTATLTFIASGTLSSIAVLTQGAPNLDFNFVSGGTCATGTPYTVGQTCTVNYTFTPTHPGARYGGITLTTSTGALLANNYVQGTGTGPQVVWSPGTQSPLFATFKGPYSVAVGGSGDIFVADTFNNAIQQIHIQSGATFTKTIGGFNPLTPWPSTALETFLSAMSETPR